MLRFTMLMLMFQNRGHYTEGLKGKFKSGSGGLSTLAEEKSTPKYNDPGH